MDPDDDDDFLPPDYDVADDRDDDIATFLPPRNLDNVRPFRQPGLPSGGNPTELCEPSVSGVVHQTAMDTLRHPVSIGDDGDIGGDTLAYSNCGYRDDIEVLDSTEHKENLFPAVRHLRHDQAPRTLHRNIIEDDMRPGSQNSDETNESETLANNKKLSNLPVSFRTSYTVSGNNQNSHDTNLSHFIEHSTPKRQLLEIGGQSISQKSDRKGKMKRRPENVPLQNLGFDNRAMEGEVSDEAPPSTPPPQIVVEAVNTTKNARSTGVPGQHRAPPAQEGKQPQIQPQQEKSRKQKRKEPPSDHLTLDKLLEEEDQELSEDLGNMLQARRKRSFRGNKRKSTKARYGSRGRLDDGDQSDSPAER